MKLAYQAYDKAGRSVTDTIEAPSMDEASEQLRRRGLYVTSLRQGHAKGGRAADAASAEAAPLRQGVRLRGNGKRLKNLAMFTRQLYVLACTGTPLTEALHALARQAKDPSWRRVIEDLALRVEEGSSLADAMGAHPDCFDHVYRSLVASGETGGKFEPIMDRLSQLVRRRLQMRSAVVGALVYPSLLLVVAGGVLGLMLMFVLPRFGALFETLDLPLPPTTQALLWISDAIRGYWWAMLGTVALTVGGAWAWSRTASGQLAIDTVLIRVPLLGAVVRSFIVARIIRLLGVLVDSYVPLLEALALTKAAAGNAVYRRLVADAEHAVTRGDPVSSAFSDAQLVNPTVYEAIRSGESSGKLSAMMLNMADFLDEENEVVLKALTSILEPIILIVLGVLVGLVALGMFLPLFDLTAQAGSGG